MARRMTDLCKVLPRILRYTARAARASESRQLVTNVTNPKSESRNPKQIRNSKHQWQNTAAFRISAFEFCFEFRISNFGFQIWISDLDFGFNYRAGFAGRGRLYHARLQASRSASSSMSLTAARL